MNSSSANNVWRCLGLWALAVTFAHCGLAVVERQSLVPELTTKSATLHRLVSQSTDQHDAHLTSLSAIFVAGGISHQDLFLDVGATIMRFYPRITSVNVIPFDPSYSVIQIPPGLVGEDAAWLFRWPQIASILPSPLGGETDIRQPGTHPGLFFRLTDIDCLTGLWPVYLSLRRSVTRPAIRSSCSILDAEITALRDNADVPVTRQI